MSAPRRPAPPPALLIAVICVVEVLSMSAFSTFPALLPTFQHEWGLANTAAGWISGIYFAGYVGAAAVLTALTDRIDAKRVYLGSMALSVVGAAGFGWAASGVWSASLWRLIQGVGLAGTYMPGLKVLSDVLPARIQSRGTALYTSSFSVGASVSYFLAGALDPAFGWHITFALCALGPLAGLILGALVLPASPPLGERPSHHLLDFRPVIANRRALGFTLAYAVHAAELFAFRAWVVAYLVFSQGLQPAGTLGLLWSAATIAALVNLLAMTPASLLINEVATRIGRQPVIIAAMTLSAIIATLFGFSSSLPFALVVGLAFAHGLTINADSATLTAGLVRVAEARHKGATMAMHSVIGFSGAFLGPLIFGVVLDLAGGTGSGLAWGLAFATLGLLPMLGPLAIARFVGLRERVY